MKRIYTIIIIGVVALLASCTKIYENPRYTPTQEESTLSLTGNVTFEVSMENAGTKASLTNTGEARWLKADAIAAICSDGTPVKLSLDGTGDTRKAFFKGTVPDGKTLGGLIIYPYDAFKSIDTDGNVTLDLTSSVGGSCSVMGAVIGSTNKVELKQLMAYVVLKMDNINANARSINVESDVQLCGTFTVKKDALLSGGVPAVQKAGTTPLVITFSGAPDKSTSVSVPVPIGKITTLKATTYTSEGKIMVSEDIISSSISTTMAQIRTCEFAFPDYSDRKPVKDGYALVADMYWALGNLTYNSTIQDEDGFQSGWHLASSQWMYRGYDQGEAFNKNSKDYNGTALRADYGLDNNYYNHFTFGAIAEPYSYSASGGFITGNAAVDVTGGMFLDNECTQTAQFANAKYGDLAYWATNGRLRLPSKAEMEKLTTEADAQYGYVCVKDAQGESVKVLGIDLKVWGMYFTDMKGDKPVVTETEREITQEELTNGNGLFLPLAGRKANSSDVQVISTRNIALYWCGQGSDDPCSSKYTYGYAWSLKVANGSIAFKSSQGDAYTRNSGFCIRPILIEK